VKFPKVIRHGGHDLRQEESYPFCRLACRVSGKRAVRVAVLCRNRISLGLLLSPVASDSSRYGVRRNCARAARPVTFLRPSLR